MSFPLRPALSLPSLSEGVRLTENGTFSRVFLPEVRLVDFVRPPAPAPRQEILSMPVFDGDFLIPGAPSQGVAPPPGFNEILPAPALFADFDSPNNDLASPTDDLAPPTEPETGQEPTFSPSGKSSKNSGDSGLSPNLGVVSNVNGGSGDCDKGNTSKVFGTRTYSKVLTAPSAPSAPSMKLSVVNDEVGKGSPKEVGPSKSKVVKDSERVPTGNSSKAVTAAPPGGAAKGPLPKMAASQSQSPSSDFVSPVARRTRGKGAVKGYGATFVKGRTRKAPVRQPQYSRLTKVPVEDGFTMVRRVKVTAGKKSQNSSSSSGPSPGSSGARAPPAAAAEKRPTAPRRPNVAKPKDHVGAPSSSSAPSSGTKNADNLAVNKGPLSPEGLNSGVVKGIPASAAAARNPSAPVIKTVSPVPGCSSSSPPTGNLPNSTISDAGLSSPSAAATGSSPTSVRNLGSSPTPRAPEGSVCVTCGGVTPPRSQNPDVLPDHTRPTGSQASSSSSSESEGGTPLSPYMVGPMVEDVPFGLPDGSLGSPGAISIMLSDSSILSMNEEPRSPEGVTNEETAPIVNEEIIENSVNDANVNGPAPALFPGQTCRIGETLHLVFPITSAVKCTEAQCQGVFVSRDWTSMKQSLIRHLKHLHDQPVPLICRWCMFCEQEIPTKISRHSCLRNFDVYCDIGEHRFKCRECSFSCPSSSGIMNHFRVHKRENIVNRRERERAAAALITQTNSNATSTSNPNLTSNSNENTHSSQTRGQSVQQQNVASVSASASASAPEDAMPSPGGLELVEDRTYEEEEFEPDFQGSQDEGGALMESQPDPGVDFTEAELEELVEPDAPSPSAEFRDKFVVLLNGPGNPDFDEFQILLDEFIAFAQDFVKLPKVRATYSPPPNVRDPKALQGLYRRNRRRAVRLITKASESRCELPHE